ncbi:aldo/keto reductase [Tsuneonella sp. YG55]|uniref:Aldo/keto reductase n=1 Tax=Tsuneonella litorea TaxID=2976475 RepID=A0A9X2VZ49_9SPHN|nr:aldo/keto reductase [Tsuneonella litorea]MCT2558027.1 aldo/keto reductase [Tsuneonella litorea]
MMAKHDFMAGIPLVLGGNVFGWATKGDETLAVLDKFYEAGGRMIDTADVYSAWVEGHEGGESESEIGRWLSSRGVRDEMRLHTKTGMLGGKELYEPERVLKSLDASLDRLGTDRVDLYYAHKDYPDLAIEQIVEAFDGAVRSGKAKAIGASNFDVQRLEDAVEHARSIGAAAFSALQNEYNLAAREAYGEDMRASVIDNGLVMLPYFGLAAGYLTGKYRTEDDFKKSIRGGRAKQLAGANGPRVLAAMDDVAAETGASHAAIALAWLVRQAGIPAPIASARTADQLDDLLEFTRVELTDDQVDRLTAAGS